MRKGIHKNLNTTFQGSVSQFYLTSHENDPHGLPHDFYSIMHYKKDDAAKPGTITIETLDKQYQVGYSRFSSYRVFVSILMRMEVVPIEFRLQTYTSKSNMFKDVIGNQNQPSKYDYKKICLMYKCNFCMGEKMEHQRSKFLKGRSRHNISSIAIAECEDKNHFLCYQVAIFGRLRCNEEAHMTRCCGICRELKLRRSTRLATLSSALFPFPPIGFTATDDYY